MKNVLSTLLLCSCLISTSWAAAPSDSTQQALEQLRLLQRSYGANTGAVATATNPPANSAAANIQALANAPQAKAAAAAAAANTGTTAAAKKEEALTNTQLQLQSVANATAATAAQVSDEELINERAFDGVTRQLFPLSSEQIVRLRQLYNTSEFALATTAGTPPKPTATSQLVNLSPGSTPPVIRLSQGFVSSLVFLDSTGAPWPISAYDLGDPSSFNIQWDKTSNTLMIQANKLYNYGNLAVRLRDLNTPVMLTLIPGQKAVDYRVDLRIEGFGPNAIRTQTEIRLPPHANDVLLHVLDGVPPAGSHRLTVSGGDARAWLLNDKMYVRTNLTIMSPAWLGSMTSADGTHAYEMQKSPVLLVSWHGKVMQLKIEGL
jgi:intracellular multiplication protein IcmK